MNIFRDVLLNMPRLFCLFCVLVIPIIVVFRIGGDIDYTYDVDTSYGKFSIANLGFDSAKC